jgi:hypothetical protein
LAVTEAFAVSVNVHVRVFWPPLEHAPDQTASRPLDTLNVIDVPVANEAEPVDPTLTLIPVGFEITRSPVRPVAVTVNVAVVAAGLTVNVAVRLTSPSLPVIVAGVEEETALVTIVKAALVAPCATVTFAGTPATGSLLESVTVNPPAGAADDNVTVPCEFEPPVTLVGFTARLLRLGGGGGGVTVRVADRDAPLYAAVSVTLVFDVTAVVATGKVALVAPAATVILDGVDATALLLLVSETTAPPDGASAVSVTVPVADAPPVTDVGLTLAPLRAAGPLVVKCGRRAIHSRKKSRDVELATLITRTRKFAFPRSVGLQVRPHVSAEPPSVNVARLVPSVPVAFAAVQVVPPSQDSCTHILGVPDVLSARASSRTSIPATAEPAGTVMPKS